MRVTCRVIDSLERFALATFHDIRTHFLSASFETVSIFSLVFQSNCWSLSARRNLSNTTSFKTKGSSRPTTFTTNSKSTLQVGGGFIHYSPVRGQNKADEKRKSL